MSRNSGYLIIDGKRILPNNLSISYDNYIKTTPFNDEVKKIREEWRKISLELIYNAKNGKKPVLFNNFMGTYDDGFLVYDDLTFASSNFIIVSVRHTPDGYHVNVYFSTDSTFSIELKEDLSLHNITINH